MADYMFQESQPQTYWWDEDKSQLHDAVSATIKFLDTYQGYRRVDNLRNLRLYGNLKVLGISAASYARTESNDMRKNRVTLNIIQSMCDTVTNKICKNKPKIQFLTSEGNQTQQSRAKKLTKFIAGQFYNDAIYMKGSKVFLDCTVFDIGVMKHYRLGNKIVSERVFPDEIRWDDIEGVYGNPQQLFQEKDLPREQLLKMYPGFKRQILAAKRAGDGTGQNIADMVRVTESWKLSSSKEAKDGCHAITIENATFLKEKYEKTYFPFSFMRWADRLRGFGGQSLAERLTGKQLEINKLLRTIQIALHLNGVPKWLVDIGSNVVSAHINNEVGGIIKYRGTAPSLQVFNSIPPDLLEHLKYLIQSSYEEAGVSQLSAQSKKPDGLDSGKAIREFNDIESERFMLAGQMNEEFYLDCARQRIELAKEIYRDEGEFKVTAVGKKFIETIDWSEIDLEEDQYVMQMFPVSFLSATPSGKMNDAIDLVKAGFMDKDNAMRILDFPDLDQFISLATAAIEDIDLVIEKIIEKGEFNPPEPFQNLQLGTQRMQSAYLRAKLNKVDPERLELMRNWIQQAQAMLSPPAPTTVQDPNAPPLDQAALPPMPGGMPMPGEPQTALLAKPEQLPPSPLVPQAVQPNA